MAYLVTGGTGFVGRFVVGELLSRGDGPVTLVVRPGSEHKLDTLRASWEGEPVEVVEGDLSQPGVVDAAARASLQDVRHVFHLAAIYDMEADDAQLERANVDGTRHLLELVNGLPNATLHHVSSVAVAGDHKGPFKESDLDVGQKFPHAYHRTKFLSEKLVRDTCERPFRIYRPGLVVGSSETGEADKIDGPYYFFKLIQRLRGMFPPWAPLPFIEGDRVPIVPVDYVARAVVALAHADGLDGKAFHLVGPKPHSTGDVANIFCKAAHAPEISMRIDTRMFGALPVGSMGNLLKLPMLRNARDQAIEALGIPASLFASLGFRARFQSKEGGQALAAAGIECPDLTEYAWKLWDYWERQMDPELPQVSLPKRLKGKVVVITGASSGIGEALARKVAAHEGIVALVARREDLLEKLAGELRDAGGEAHCFPCDLTDLTAIDATVDQIHAQLGGIDVLVNNAGRSIRRGVMEAVDRFHDYERTMQLNYFGSLRVILRALPRMVERKHGHVINVSSIGVLSNSPRFSAYVASKAALDAFSRSIAAEVMDSGVHITTVYMPLVNTPMIAPSQSVYNLVPTLTPEEAADMLLDAIGRKPKRVATRLGTFAQVSYALMPRVNDMVLNMGYRMFPSSKSKGKDGAKKSTATLRPEAVAFAYLMKGVHF